MKKYSKIYLGFFLLLFIFTPYVSHSQLIYECAPTAGGLYGNCTFNDLINAVRNLIDRLTVLAIGASVIVIAYAGFLYMRSGDNPGLRREANKMFSYVGIGIFFMIAAWLIVNLIARGMGATSFVFRP